MEEGLLAVICDAILKPENFAAVLEKTIKDMRSKISDLERDTAPLEEALSDVNEELRRIDRSWIRGRLPADELPGLENIDGPGLDGSTTALYFGSGKNCQFILGHAPEKTVDSHPLADRETFVNQNVRSTHENF